MTRAPGYRVAEPVERATGGGHRRPDAVQPGQRCRRDEGARHLDWLVPVHAEAARRATQVVCIAGLGQPGPEIAREGVIRARGDRDAGPRPRARRRTRSDLPTTAPISVTAGRRSIRKPVVRATAAGSGGAWPGDDRRRPARSAGTRATPKSRGTSARWPPPRVRGAPARALPAAARAPTLGCPSRQRAPPPLAADRVSRKVIAGRIGSAVFIDRDERRAVAVEADGDDVDRLGRPQRVDRDDHGGPPRARVLLRPTLRPDVERISGTGDRQQPPVEPD